jgi:AbiV family abortive infection protein
MIVTARFTAEKRTDAAMEMETFLGQFETGAITPHEIARGMHLSFKNAAKLARESKLLVRHRASARAFSLAVLGLEELGRVPLLLNGLFLDQNDVAGWKVFWNKLRSHHCKQSVWSVYGSLLRHQKHAHAAHYEDRYPAGIEPLLDKFKQMGFYVSFHRGQFLEPGQFASDNRRWLRYLLSALESRVASLRELHGTLDSSERVVRAALRLYREAQGDPQLTELFKRVKDAARTR